MSSEANRYVNRSGILGAQWHHGQNRSILGDRPSRQPTQPRRRVKPVEKQKQMIEEVEDTKFWSRSFANVSGGVRMRA